VLAVLIATAWAYADVRHHGFFELDDPIYVAANPVVQAGLTREGFAWAFTNSYATWHPLTWLSLMLDCELFGVDAGAHHLVNLGLHLANTALLLALLASLTGAFWQSLVVAGLFALHPLHVESVAWISERKDVLSTLFGLLTLAAYAGFTRRPSAPRYLLVAGGLTLALLAKPVWVALPVLLLLLDVWPLARLAGGVRPGRLLVEKLPLLAIAALASLATLYTQQEGGSLAPMELFGFGERVANAISSGIAYLAQTVWPQGLAVYYPHPGELAALPTLLAGAVLVAVTAWTWRERERHPYLVFGWLWYGISLLPVIGLVQSGSQARADRYTYVPLIGIFVAVVWTVGAMTERSRAPRWVAAVVAAAALLACAGLTRAQVDLWRDSVTLLEHTLRVTPPNPVAHLNLGAALARQGRLDDAVEQYREATRLEPRLAEAHYDLGVILARQGRLEEAIEAYEQARARAPREARIHVQLGVARAAQGRLEDAVEHYREAVRLAPGLLQARSNLGLALLNGGHVDQAIDQFRETLQQQPGFVPARVNLALALARQGDLTSAEQELREALRLAPEFVPAHVQLGMVLAAQGRRAEGIAQIEAALRIRPDDVQAARVLRALQQAPTEAE